MIVSNIVWSSVVIAAGSVLTYEIIKRGGKDFVLRNTIAKYGRLRQKQIYNKLFDLKKKGKRSSKAQKKYVIKLYKWDLKLARINSCTFNDINMINKDNIKKSTFKNKKYHDKKTKKYFILEYKARLKYAQGNIKKAKKVENKKFRKRDKNDIVMPEYHESMCGDVAYKSMRVDGIDDEIRDLRVFLKGNLPKAKKIFLQAEKIYVSKKSKVHRFVIKDNEGRDIRVNSNSLALFNLGKLFLYLETYSRLVNGEICKADSFEKNAYYSSPKQEKLTQKNLQLKINEMILKVQNLEEINFQVKQFKQEFNSYIANCGFYQNANDISREQ